MSKLTVKAVRAAEARFWSKVDKTGDCWIWLAGKREGYGQFWVVDYSHLAHRVSYIIHTGLIPDDKLVIDHLCRNHACVNPKHLELVSTGENVLRGIGITAELKRKTVCTHGHPLEGENLHVTKTGYRKCKKCNARRTKELYYRQKVNEL